MTRTIRLAVALALTTLVALAGCRTDDRPVAPAKRWPVVAEAPPASGQSQVVAQGRPGVLRAERAALLQ